MTDIFTQFDMTFGDGYYSAIPTLDGDAEIFNNGAIVAHYDSAAATMQNGQMILHTDNVFGGQDTVIDGKVAQSTQANVMGGETIYRDGEIHAVTVPDVHGGVDIYNGDMTHEATTFSNVYGGEDYLSFQGNADKILEYSDPLIHSTEYRMNPLSFS